MRRFITIAAGLSIVFALGLQAFARPGDGGGRGRGGGGGGGNISARGGGGGGPSRSGGSARSFSSRSGGPSVSSRGSGRSPQSFSRSPSSRSSMANRPSGPSGRSSAARSFSRGPSSGPSSRSLANRPSSRPDAAQLRGSPRPDREPSVARGGDRPEFSRRSSPRPGNFDSPRLSDNQPRSRPDVDRSRDGSSSRRDFINGRIADDRSRASNRPGDRIVDNRDRRPEQARQFDRDGGSFDNRFGDRGPGGDRQARNRTDRDRTPDFDVGRRRVDDDFARNWNRDGRDRWDNRDRDWNRGSDRAWDRYGNRDRWDRDHRGDWNRDHWKRDVKRWASHGSRYWYAGYRPWHRGWHYGYWNYWRPHWNPWAWYGLRSIGWWGYPLASYYYYNPYCTAYYGYSGYGYGTTYNTTNYYVDYSQPIPAAPVEPTAQQQTAEEQAAALFDDARALFANQDYTQASAKTAEAIALVPSDAALHEFRALCQFALGNYKDAAAGVYAVLSAGPGWNWDTMSRLYDDPRTYTNQLRALENHSMQNPQAADTKFLLAYHYLVTGQANEATKALQKVVELQPDDRLAASLLQAVQQPAQAEEPLLPPQRAEQQ